MAGRAGGALTALLALAAAAPATLLLGTAAPADAVTRAVGQAPVSVAITGMTPQQARPGATITVTGTLTNTSRQQISHLTVQLLAGSTPLSTVAELQPATAEADGLAGNALPGASFSTSGELQAGATDHWSIRVKARAIGMTAFGVYPIAAQAQSALLAVPLATALSYLPYVPAKKGPYGYSIPAPAKVAWVWPLIDQPLLNEPWQGNCSGSQAATLAASVRSNGRLGQLVTAAGASGGSQDGYSAAAGPGNTTVNRASGAQPPQSLAAADGITWAVDPALLANVKALAGCGSRQPSWASAARSWLAEVSRVSSGQPLFVTPFADPNVAALIGAGFAADVRQSVALGRTLGTRILGRNVSPPAGPATTPETQAAAIAWPADGISGYGTAENLAASDGVRTLLLSSAALPGEQATVLRALNGGGGYLNLVLANASLTQLLGAGGSAKAGAFATSQEFLAQTALLAQLDPGQPIVVAPPQRWLPAAGLPADVLADTDSASWLRPVSVTSLTGARKVPTVADALLSTVSTRYPRLTRPERRGLSQLDRETAQLQTMKARPSFDLDLAVATAESSAWQGSARATALAMLKKLTARITDQEKGVQVVAENRVTLGGLKGSVPVSIDNRLGYAVQVRLRLHYSSSNGIKITTIPQGLIAVPARTSTTVRLRVQAIRIGSTAIAISLQNRAFHALPARTVLMTVEATQVGVLGVIIFAAALGVALIAYAARAARGGRRSRGAGQPPGPSAGSGPAEEQSTTQAEPDTVMAERTGLGTARQPGT